MYPMNQQPAAQWQNPQQGGQWGMQQPQMQQPQQMLPYDYLNIMVQPLAMQVNTPPFVPQIQCSPALQAWVPSIVYLTINEIQASIGRNALRTFMFNQYAQAGYQNAHFVGLVSMIAIYTEVLLMSGRGSEQQCISQAIGELCSYAAADAVNEFPALFQVINPQEQSNVRTCLTNLALIEQQCQQRKQQMMAPPPGYNPGFQQGNFQRQPQVQQMQGRQNTGWGQQGGQWGGHQQSVGLSSSTSGLLVNQQAPSFGNRQTPVNNRDLPSAQARASSELARWSRKSTETTQIQPSPQSAWKSEHSPAIQQQVQTFDAQQPVQPQSIWSERVTKEQANAAILKQTFKGREPTAMPTNAGFNPAAIRAEWGTDIDTAMIREEEAAQGSWGEAQIVQNGDQLFGTYPVEFDQPKPAETIYGQRYTEEQLPSGYKWKTSKEQPYLPAYNPQKFKLYYTINQNGLVIAIIEPKTESEMRTMDYDKHAIGRVPTQPSMFPKKGAEKEEIKNYADAPSPKISVQTTQVFVLEANESIGMINGHIESVIDGALAEPNSAVRKNIYIAEPLPCDNGLIAKHYRDSITEISKAGNFGDAVRILKNMSAPEELLLANKINDVLTTELQKVLSVNLTLKIKISSFIEDASSLDADLRKYDGDDIANALKEQEGKLLMRTLGTLTKEEGLSFQNDLMGHEIPESDALSPPSAEQASSEELDDKPTLAFLTSNVTYTYLSSYMYELNIALPGGKPAMLTEPTSPNLYKLATELFDAEIVRKTNFRAHYFITKDGIKFEITRGYLNKASYILALV